MTTLILILSLALVGSGGAGASQALRDAEAAYESGGSQACLDLLERVERSAGRSPRVESLRAFALADLGRTIEAYRSVRIYLALTAGRDLSGNPAHADLVRLGAKLREEFEAKRQRLQDQRETLKQEGLAQVDAAESAARSDVESRVRERERQFQAFQQDAWRRRLHLNAADARRDHEGGRRASADGAPRP